MKVTMPSLSPVALNSDLWRLDLRWISPVIRIGGIKYYLVFEPGYTTDGASIPRFFWRLVGHPMQMPLLICALPHDGLYSGELCTRAEADAVIQALARRFHISLAKRNVIWLAVRAGGWNVWRKHTAKSIEKSRGLCKLVRAERMEELGLLAQA